MVYVMASIVAQPEQAQAVRTLLAGLAAESRREPGCLSYEVFQRPDLPNVFRTVEQWQAIGDVDAHMRSPHVAKAIAAAQAMLAEPPEIVSYARVDTP